MVNMSSFVFSVVALFLGAMLIYFDHTVFAIVFLVSDLLVFLAVKSMAKKEKDPPVEPVAFCFAFVGLLIVSHFTFRGVYGWDDFQPLVAVRNIQLSGGGEILLSFSMCVIVVAIVHRKLGVKND